MSHNVHHSVYDENVNKSRIQQYWDEYAAREDYDEGCSGLSQDIRWIDHVCKSEQEAYKYIEEHDSGWYDQLAVKFIRGNGSYKEPASMKRLKDQITNYKQKLTEYEEKHSLTNQKAAYISCPSCGSKLNRLMLRGNGCPVCRKSDIRADYIISQVKSYKDKINKWEKELKNEIEEREKTKKPVIKWLVKIEYHT